MASAVTTHALRRQYKGGMRVCAGQRYTKSEPYHLLRRIITRRFSLRITLVCLSLLRLPSTTGGLSLHRALPHQLQLEYSRRDAVILPTSRGLKMASFSSHEAETAATVPRVAVIGAGGAGLAAGRLLREEGCQVTIFDKSEDVGGVWRYRPEPEAHAPMYRSLVTNLPNEIMSFFGYPFPDILPSFTTHAQVLDYLKSYSEHYNLRPMIKFGCPVTSVRPLLDSHVGASGVDQQQTMSRTEGTVGRATTGDGRSDSKGGTDSGKVSGGKSLGKWEVVYSETLSGKYGESGNGRNSAKLAGMGSSSNGDVDDSGFKTYGSFVSKTETFDAVCVCNGHYDEPFTPEAEGLDGFRGVMMHSRAYDRPDVKEFVDKRVLCVGSRSSGTDVAREVSSAATIVHVCDRAADHSVEGGGERGNVWWRPELTKFEGGNTVHFKDGTTAEVDTIVWCTGYNYSFPFLEDSGLLTPPVTQRVHPLYEQIFHVHYPSLSFVGLPQSIVPFPVFDLQANAVAAVISGRAPLPSRAERERWLLEEEGKALEERGVSPASRGIHVMGGRQWAYMKRLLRLARGPGAVLTPCTQNGAENVKTPEVDVGEAALGSAEEGHTTDGTSSSRDGVIADRGESVSGSDGDSDDLVDRVWSAVKEGDAGSAEDIMRELLIREAIYNDTGDNRPAFPGGSDDYRRRLYRVDPKTGKFSVSMADRKANGEGPSAVSARSSSAPPDERCFPRPKRR